ncbi:ABC transporter permease [Pontibacter locisalis]|uniref:ABC transporter permease n=1 Tax=Pontibacter locisalis TaxID=1719035 RepID=A0ABW5IFU1_9BACT
MLPFLLKRLLLALPALWLLATVIFVLSRLLPGPSGAEQILQENGGYYNKGSVESRQEAYRSYLKRTGQDLPLFYFSLKAGTQPDTLDLVFPESDRLLLQRLSWHYGNWPLVAAYFKSLKNVEVALGHASSIQELELLYTSTSPEYIQAHLNALAGTTAGSQATAEIQELKIAAAKLIDQQNKLAFLTPSLQWHGYDNQYHRWLTDLFSGNTGNSYRDLRPVHDVLFEAIGNTFWLVLFSIIVAFGISLELSLQMTIGKVKTLKKILLPSLFLMDSIPLFLLALLLLVLFASPAFVQCFPVFGMSIPAGTTSTSKLALLYNQLPHMALPAICLILANIPFLTTLIYRKISEEAKTDYARTARAKGLTESQVIRRHVLRNSLLPVITILTDALPALIAGTVVVETIFAIPGMGRLLVNSVMSRDYPVIVAIVLVVATFRVLVYLLADIGYGLADPRTRQQNV